MEELSEMRWHSTGTRDDLTAVIWQMDGMYYQPTDSNFCEKQAIAVKPEKIQIGLMIGNNNIIVNI